jgi:hypothetical protein
VPRCRMKRMGASLDEATSAADPNTSDLEYVRATVPSTPLRFYVG